MDDEEITFLSSYMNADAVQILRRLRILVEKMDLDKDGFVDKSEMHAWILRSFKSLSKEESEERFEDNDEDENGIITWLEYKRAEFDLDDDEDYATIAGKY